LHQNLVFNLKRGDAQSPLFLSYPPPAMAQFDRNRIQQLLADALGDSGLYVVGLTVSDSVMPKITVTLDGPNGLGIQECAQVTRRLNRGMEEAYGEEAAYSLEVTSPGADQPLTDPRQYPRHIGRSLALKLADGSEKTGPLTAVTPEGIELEEVIKVKTKKTTLPAAFFPFGDIKEATVVISFK
jgi:ribosome maturation factor RimP